MIIDTWGGWRWTCFNCDYTSREATNREIEENERLLQTYCSKQKLETEEKNEVQPDQGRAKPKN